MACDRESVEFLRVDERLDRIVVDFTRKLGVRVDAYEVVVLERERVAEEEARHEATHVAVFDRVRAVDHVSVDLFDVEPFGHRPLLARNESVLDARVGQRLDRFAKVLRELVRVEEYVRIVAFAVEAHLEVDDCLGECLQIAISGYDDDARVDAVCVQNERALADAKRARQELPKAHLRHRVERVDDHIEQQDCDYFFFGQKHLLYLLLIMNFRCKYLH